MSIVGPRPERPEIAEEYSKVYPAFSLRLKEKAGLTGLAQVYGQYNTEPVDKLKMDLIYIVNYSILLDVQIIFETVRVIFSRESTAGFGDEQTWYSDDAENDEEKKKGRDSVSPDKKEEGAGKQAGQKIV
jgi:hypothetical protein